MEKEVLLDAANEEILKEADDIFGVPDLKENLRRIIMYSKLKKENKNIEGNYNIFIYNRTAMKNYNQLVSLIAKLYHKNGIINNEKYELLEDEEKKRRRNSSEKNDEKKDGKNGTSIFVFGERYGERWRDSGRDEVYAFMKKHPNKVYIYIDTDYSEGEADMILMDSFFWRLKIDEVKGDELTDYINWSLKKYKLDASDKVIEKLKKMEFWKIKRFLNMAKIDCQIRKTNKISDEYFKSDNEVNKNNSEKPKNYKNGIEELNSLIGITEVKKQVEQVINYIKINKERSSRPMLHMCFTGNPGTGKTTVARIISRIFAEEKIISENSNFVEAQRSDLIGKYVGWTAIQTKKKIDEALGGVLFIDEAYTLASDAGHGFGDECIATLIKEMEDNRDNLCVILAGYTKEMQKLFEANSGFKSRIQFNVEFPNYTAEELYEIFKKMCKDEKYKLSSNVKNSLIDLFEEARKQENFSNGRYVRNLFEKIKFEQASRVVKNDEDIHYIKKEDIINVTKKEELTMLSQKNKIGFAV